MNNQQQPKKSTNDLLWLVFIVIILALISYVVYVSFLKKADNVSNTNTPVQNTNIITNTNTTVDTTDWKVYKNTEYGFLFKYPQDWIVETKKATSGFFKSNLALGQMIISDPESPYSNPDYDFYDSCNLSIFTNEKDLNLQDWINNSNIYIKDGEGVYLLQSNEKKINNINGIEVKEGGPNFTSATSFYFAQGNKIIRYGYFTGMDIDIKEVFKNYAAICLAIKESLDKI